MVKIQYKLFFINNKYKYNKNISNNIEQNRALNFTINELNNIQKKRPIFHVYKDRAKQFIKNVVKYDKTLLKNDFSSLIEIK